MVSMTINDLAAKPINPVLNRINTLEAKSKTRNLSLRPQLTPAIPHKDDAPARESQGGIRWFGMLQPLQIVTSRNPFQAPWCRNEWPRDEMEAREVSEADAERKHGVSSR